MSDEEKTPLEEAAEDQISVVPADLSDMTPYVSGYRFSYWRTRYEDRYIELVPRGHAGDDIWALIDGRECFNKVSRRWVYEMLPSGRSDKFLEECRMTLDEARQIIPREVWSLNQHAIRRVARIIENYRAREAAKAVGKTEETSG